MKKRIILVVSGIAICLGILFSFQLKNKNNLQENNIKHKNGSLAIMIKENGATDYTKSSSNTIPVGDYILNEEKTYCKNNGKVGNYDNITGTISLSFIGTDKCYLYFDYKEEKNIYKLIAKRYNSNDTYVKLYNPVDEGDPNTYANNIYYFNGAVENNNVLFAGFCWKMVRTTDTGGVKMIYNGAQTNGSCNNTGDAAQIGTSTFNDNDNSPAYVGYMYNIVYERLYKDMSSESNIVFGNSFVYSGKTYTLKNTMTTTKWSSDYTNLKNNHYTCFTTESTCTSIYYVFFANDIIAYYIILNDGKSVDDAINEMLYADDVNKKDSTIKAYIDLWYKNNMINYTDKLEDTVFCNDRVITSYGGWNANGGDPSDLASNVYLYFKNTKTYGTVNYSLSCTNELDKFSIKNNRAKLIYPVGLLSAPEVWLAYKDESYKSHYLKSGNAYWLASPAYFQSIINHMTVISNGNTTHNINNDKLGVRPVVSLKPDTEYASGDGSYTNPFIVD